MDAQVERDVRRARHCYVAVHGSRSQFWARLTKPEAENLLQRGGDDFVCWVDDDGDLKIDAATN